MKLAQILYRLPLFNRPFCISVQQQHQDMFTKGKEHFTYNIYPTQSTSIKINVDYIGHLAKFARCKETC